MPSYIRIYRETFTEKELNDLIAFYESPTGKNVCQKNTRHPRKDVQCDAAEDGIHPEQDECHAGRKHEANVRKTLTGNMEISSCVPAFLQESVLFASGLDT